MPTISVTFYYSCGTFLGVKELFQEQGMPRHRAPEFRKFLDEIERNVPTGLDMHVIMDNASSHKTKLIRRWFAKRSHWHAHFTPTSSSWINQVERFFALLSEQQIKR